MKPVSSVLQGWRWCTLDTCLPSTQLRGTPTRCHQGVRWMAKRPRQWLRHRLTSWTVPSLTEQPSRPSGKPLTSAPSSSSSPTGKRSRHSWRYFNSGLFFGQYYNWVVKVPRVFQDRVWKKKIIRVLVLVLFFNNKIRFSFFATGESIGRPRWPERALHRFHRLGSLRDQPSDCLRRQRQRHLHQGA